MAQITLINADAAAVVRQADLMLTDPPYELDGAQLRGIIDRYGVDHLVLITTMRQLLAFMTKPGWHMHFDFVLDGVAPKKSMSFIQPNYVHQTGVYLSRHGTKSVFSRKLRKRDDVYESNGYWPTIFHAPRQNMREHGHAKNQQAITSLLGSFAVKSVIDPFAGSGTTLLAAFELGIPATGVERCADTFTQLLQTFKFLGLQTEVIQ